MTISAPDAIAQARRWREDATTAHDRGVVTLGTELATELRAHAPTTLDAALAGHVLVVAAAALSGLLTARAHFGGHDTTAISHDAAEALNIAALAGLALVDAAQDETDAAADRLASHR